jgi:hypothetical protein
MKKTGIALLLFFLFIFLAFNKHSKDDYQSYHSVLWADASGYYIYNPICFIYGNHCNALPPDIVSKTGTGFTCNKQTDRIITKYTSGIAILQSPFFLIAHLLSGPLGFPSDGFSPIYHRAIMIAGAFYGLLGILFSFLFLKKYFSEKISFITVAVFFLSTNLYYYTLDASGFLHVYAFFLISVVAFLNSRIYEQPRLRYLLPFFIALALAVLIRPTNIVLILFVLFFDGPPEIHAKFLFFKKSIRLVAISFLVSLIIFIPQMIYWQQSFNSPVVYSYGEEGFFFLLSPKFIPVWFSPRNGLFVYAPVLVISIAGMIMSFLQKNRNGIVTAILFFVTSYIFSSWWNYWFGCAMGARSFVEYYPVLMFPFAYAFSQVKNKAALLFIYIFFIGCIWINMNIIYYYDGCFYGGEWDWNAYFKLVID